MHAKHEAFRFKYVTKGLVELEQGVMRIINFVIYLNALAFYAIVLMFPLFFTHPCGEGFDNRAHAAYGAYAFANVIFETSVVFYVVKSLNSNEEKVIELNRWHVVELLFGQIARFDTYLDVCFLSLLVQCQSWNLVIPIATFIFLSLLYPLFILVKKLRTPTGLKHTMPNIERICHICFLRENMLLATVLDSICINNQQNFCKRRVVFGKLMGTLSFFL